MYHAKKIGIFISHIFGVYQQGVCQGIIDKAAEYGYTAEIFTSLDGENLGSYALGEESIMQLPNYDSFDGIIFASDTYISQELRRKIAKRLKALSCPIMEITAKDTQFPAISLENNSMTGELTSHFLTAHGAARVCFLGCASESYISDIRESYYRKTLEKNGKTPGENDIYLCRYEMEDVERALAFFCQEKTPKAVVCYNDRLALMFLSAALAAGYRVPEDIAISGCDDTPDGRNASPMLTTVSFPVYELGIRALESLLALIRGGSPDTACPAAEPLIRNSCGCNHAVNANSIFFAQALSDRIASLEASILNSMNMSSSLQYVTDLDAGMELLTEFLPQLEHCREFYLCLYADWDSVSSHILALTNQEETASDDDTILLKFAYKNGKQLPECSFLKKNLLPDYIYDDSDCAYIYVPLYFEDKKFGYIALAYEDNRIDYQFRLVQWQMNINQMLQGICEAKRTGMLVDRLEEIYMKDALTGLYNKHGYDRLEGPLLHRAIAEHLPLTAFLIDMDGLKTINDTYGHAEGDFAIQVLGQAIESTAAEGDLCARFSGDEFYMLTAGLAEKEAKQRAESITAYLDNYNKLSRKVYDISCSCGYACALPAADFTTEQIQELFSLADKNMYREKEKHHAARK